MKNRTLIWALFLSLLTILSPLLLVRNPVMVSAGPTVSPSLLVHNPVMANTGTGPLAAFIYNPCVMCAVVGDMIFFNATYSTSPNGPISSYAWDFGDGSAIYKTTNPNTNHDYPGQPGIWQVTLTVQDSTGQIDTVSQSVVFNIRPDFSFQPQRTQAGQLISFNASTSQVYGPTSFVGFAWTFGDGTTGSGKLVGHSYSAPGLYRVMLTVQTDQGNGQVSKTLLVLPPTTGQKSILRSIFGIAYYNSSIARIVVPPATLFVNMTLQGVNSTGTVFNLNQARITIGPGPSLNLQRNFTSTSGQAFQSNSGRLTMTAQMIETYSCLQYQPPCTVPNSIYQLYLTGASRLASTNSSTVFFTRLFGFLYNSQTKIGLFFVVGGMPGDVNEDGQVNVSDLAVIGSSFGEDNSQSVMSQPCTSIDYPVAYYADLNGDGTVNVSDLALVGSSFGQSY